mmetsp:Transcript_7575/g.11341  ORF Transcript_7575/g.11341 Transcript_7575/m.11341 type:complete len:521 (+) Transcript_7575:59-1621(+)
MILRLIYSTLILSNVNFLTECFPLKNYVSPPSFINRVSCKSTIEKDTFSMPNSLDEISNQALNNLYNSFQDNLKRLKVDILVPGLNPKLENSAPYNTGLLLAFLHSLLSAFKQFKSVKVLFSSAGDAGLALKTFSDMKWEKHNSEFGFLSENIAESNGTEAIIIVKPINSVGDPVILEVEKISTTLPKATIVLMNSDLEEKVALGIIERDRRTNFLKTFKQAYYFRNLVVITRPSMVPIEKGGIVYMHNHGWGVFSFDIRKSNYGPGSLNRYMNQGVYKRDMTDPTSKYPPKFYLIEKFKQEPTKEQISSCIEYSFQYINKIGIQEASEKSSSVDSVEEAKLIMKEASLSSKAHHEEKIINAIFFLENYNKKGRSDRKKFNDIEKSKPDFEELTKGKGLWKLTLLLRNSKNLTGKINYVPFISAVQYFNAEGVNENGIYILGRPLVKFLGFFEWNEVTSRLTFGYNKQQILGWTFSVGKQKSKGVPGFNMFCIEGGENGYIIGRGNTGGIALWRRVNNLD